MKVKEFISVLEENAGKELLFSYKEDQLVGANYHLTEVKNVQFDTTDCGGKTNFWEETHFQLWESPAEIGKTNYMTTDKILAILKRVDTIKPMKIETPLKLEYGNDHFPTSVMPVEHISSDSEKVYVYLFPEATLCKASIRGSETSEKEKTELCCETSGC